MCCVTSRESEPLPLTETMLNKINIEVTYPIKDQKISTCEFMCDGTVHHNPFIRSTSLSPHPLLTSAPPDISPNTTNLTNNPTQSINEQVADLTALLFNKYKMKQPAAASTKPGDYILKVTGYKEYLLG